LVAAERAPEALASSVLSEEKPSLERLSVSTVVPSKKYSESSCFPGHFSFIDVLYGTDARIVSGAK